MNLDQLRLLNACIDALFAHDHEFTSLPDFRAWERERVKQLVRGSWINGLPPRSKPPIYQTSYGKHRARFDDATERAGTRARKIYRRFVLPRLEQRERELADYARRKWGKG